MNPTLTRPAHGGLQKLAGVMRPEAGRSAWPLAVSWRAPGLTCSRRTSSAARWTLVAVVQGTIWASSRRQAPCGGVRDRPSVARHAQMRLMGGNTASACSSACATRSFTKLQACPSRSSTATRQTTLSRASITTRTSHQPVLRRPCAVPAACSCWWARRFRRRARLAPRPRGFGAGGASCSSHPRVVPAVGRRPDRGRPRRDGRHEPRSRRAWAASGHRRLRSPRLFSSPLRRGEREQFSRGVPLRPRERRLKCRPTNSRRTWPRDRGGLRVAAYPRRDVHGACCSVSFTSRHSDAAACQIRVSLVSLQTAMSGWDRVSRSSSEASRRRRRQDLPGRGWLRRSPR